MKILFVGDILLDRKMEYSEEFSKICSSYDHCVGNLEGMFKGTGREINKAGVWIHSDEEHIESLREKFDVLTLANNHTMDFGKESLNHTISLLNDNDFKHCGAGKNSTEAHKPLDLGEVFIISVAENEFGASTKTRPGMASFDDMRILYNNIKKCKEKGKVIVCYHGGSEVIPLPQKYLRERFKLLKDFGADLIIGNHPHVVQGFEDNSFYSLGNFYFIHQDSPGRRFSQYKNTDWSLVVGYDTETSKTETYCVSVKDNKVVIDESKTEELNFLCSLIIDDDYETLSDIISCVLHEKWYPDFFKGGHLTAVLHQVRCDAHKSNISTGLSRMIGEFQLGQLENHDIFVDGEIITVGKK